MGETRKGERTVHARQFMKEHSGEIWCMDKRKENVGKLWKQVS
jgi:hypothetical protein